LVGCALASLENRGFFVRRNAPVVVGGFEGMSKPLPLAL
jgi:hypothetical protein